MMRDFCGPDYAWASQFQALFSRAHFSYLHKVMQGSPDMVRVCFIDRNMSSALDSLLPKPANI